MCNPLSSWFLINTAQEPCQQINWSLLNLTGLQVRSVLIRAFNETRVGNYEFNVAAAIDWILNLQTQPQTTKQPFSDFGRAESPIHKVNNGEDYALVGKAVYQMADYVY